MGKLLRGPVNPLTAGILSHYTLHCYTAHLCLVLVQPGDVDMGEHGVGGEAQAAAHLRHVLAQALSVQDHLDRGEI